MSSDLWSYLIVAALSAAIGGSYVASRYEADISERNSRIAAQNLEIEELVREQEKQMQGMADDTALILAYDHDTVEKEFDTALSNLDVYLVFHVDTAAPADFSDRVHEDGAAVGQPLPDVTSASGGDNRARDGACHCPDRTKLRRLYERQLKIARDCDISDQHRLRVIELYEGLRNEFGRRGGGETDEGR